MNRRGRYRPHLHAELSIGDIVEARAPGGGFHLDVSEKRPAVLIAGGVGVTPMIAMVQAAVHEGLRARHVRPLTVVQAARTEADLTFADRFKSRVEASDGRIRHVPVLSRPIKVDTKGGRVTAELLRSLLSLDYYDFFLCGPGGFMQDVYNALRGLGVRDARIFAEAFGPSALTRRPDEDAPVPEAEEDEQAVVQFASSDVEQHWERGAPPLLDLAESRGLTPEFSCRNGTCGTCAVWVVEGEVTYRKPLTCPREADEALICCAVPASGTDRLVLDA